MTTAVLALTDTATTLGPAAVLLALMPLLLLLAGIAVAEPGGGSIRWIRIETTAHRTGQTGHRPPPPPPTPRRHLTGAPA
jgi:hypothetical protein